MKILAMDIQANGLTLLYVQVLISTYIKLMGYDCIESQNRKEKSHCTLEKSTGTHYEFRLPLNSISLPDSLSLVYYSRCFCTV